MTDDRRVIAFSAASIYAGAVFVQAIEEMIPGGGQASVGPGVVALALAVLLAFAGPRLSQPVLFLTGPVGVGLIGWAIATTHGYSDGAVLYMWPVLWTAAFFGVRGAVIIVVCVAAVHGASLLVMDNGQANVDRWLDVVAGVAVVAAVVRFLADHNRRLHADLTAEARTDPLTGLLNRRGLRERLEVELARAARDGSSIAVVLFDIDRFKDVNDDLGHEIGDRALVLLGAILAGEVRGVDIAARLGGDEFAAFLPNSNEDDALTLAGRIRRAFADEASPHRLQYGVATGLHITLSAGVTCASGIIDEDALRATVDQALYAAKNAGRDQAIVAGRSPADRDGQGNLARTAGPSAA